MTKILEKEFLEDLSFPKNYSYDNIILVVDIHL